MKNIIPFLVNYSPIKNLVLVPFEKENDKIYKCFELQYIDGEPYGAGYRIIAYRNDNFVDVYDDFSLKFQKDEKFDVTEKGLNQHLQVSIKKAKFENQNKCQCISFGFEDLENRKIDFIIEESSKKKSIPMNLLAPIGYGTEKPNFLPLFFMYDFDFIRKNGALVKCKIDDKKIKIDKFPLPMNMQFRYCARFSNQCELLEFANTDYKSLLEAEVQNNSYKYKNTEYIFDDFNSLSKIVVHINEEKINIGFEPSFNMNKNSQGKFKISPKEKMGFLGGIYEIQKTDKNIFIKLVPENGWTPVFSSFVTKIILKPNSIFCRWSKNYEFTEEIDIQARSVKSNWKNNNLL